MVCVNHGMCTRLSAVVKCRGVIVLQTLARFIGPLISHASGWIPDLRKPDLEVCVLISI